MNPGPSEWASLAGIVEDCYLDYDGFVIVHGTDTMAYTASALSFMLQGLGKPVVVTGSIIPMCEVYNDARRNLIVSVMFAAQLELSEVVAVFNSLQPPCPSCNPPHLGTQPLCSQARSPSTPQVVVFFNSVLLRGNRAIKVDSQGLAAFDSPNFPPLATVGATVQANRHLWLPPPVGRLRVHRKLDARVLVVRLSPGFDDAALAGLVRGPNLRGLVLSLYGTGNGPSSKEPFLQAIRDAIKGGVIVIAATQCLRGSVSLGTYEVGRYLLELGVVSAGDMTTEACVTKVAYLCGRGLEGDALRKAMVTDLRGERSADQGAATDIAHQRASRLGSL